MARAMRRPEWRARVERSRLLLELQELEDDEAFNPEDIEVLILVAKLELLDHVLGFKNRVPFLKNQAQRIHRTNQCELVVGLYQITL